MGIIKIEGYLAANSVILQNMQHDKRLVTPRGKVGTLLQSREPIHRIDGT
jgi:hypothetical protein